MSLFSLVDKNKERGSKIISGFLYSWFSPSFELDVKGGNAGLELDI